MALMFPLNPPRDLWLTSPNLHGKDVHDLQRALNIWAKAHGLAQVATDGQFGPATQHAVGAVAHSEGIQDTRPRKATLRLIYHPWMRTPAQKDRAKKLAKLQAQHGTGLAALPKIAARYIGISENPPGSNRGTPYPSGWERNFGMDGVSWCGCFSGSVVLAGGGHVTSRVAYTPFIEQDAKGAQGGFDAWVTDHRSAGPGWLVLYNWVGGSEPEHVGVVESFSADFLTAIEGNTGGSNPSDGGMVDRAHRPYHFVVGYARPRL